MTAAEADVFKKRAVNFIKTTRETLKKFQAGEGQGAGTGQGARSKDELAKQWNERIKAETDPGKRAQMKQQGIAELKAYGNP